MKVRVMRLQILKEKRSSKYFEKIGLSELFEKSVESENHAFRLAPTCKFV